MIQRHWERHVKTLLGLAFSLVLLASPTVAQTCGSLPNTLTNGSVADASDVMANFEALRTCINADGSVNSGLAGQIGYYAANGTAISGTTLSSLLDAAFGTTQGAILYRGAGGWASLAPGTSGYVLRTNGSGANPSWVAPSGGGGGISTIVGAGVSSSSSTVGVAAVPVIARPALSALSWVNQASATAAEYTNGPLVLSTTQVTTTNNINALVKSVAGSDWTVTVQYALGHHTGSSSTDIAGLIIYNSADQKMYICGLVASPNIAVWRYDSPTATPVSVVSLSKAIVTQSVWTRAKYVSATTTLTISTSIDGFTWETLLSTSTPHTGVATSYGIAVGSRYNNSGYILSLNYLGESSP